MDSFHIMPIGSIYAREEAASAGYLDIVQNLPPSIKRIISSIKTASYITGLSRSYDILEESQPSIAFAILELAIGKKTFAQLPAIFSTELGIASDKAQKMAAEIEKDIFGPIKGELDAFLQGQKGILGKSADAAPRTSPNPSFVRRGNGASQPNNLLDLKEIAAAKRQEQLAPKPTQRQLPKRQLPPPLAPPRAGGETTPTPAPTFPLPPSTPLPPKPSVTPIDFSKY